VPSRVNESIYFKVPNLTRKPGKNCAGRKNPLGTFLKEK